MSVGITSKVDFSGPFFERNRDKTFANNIRDLCTEIVEEMAKDVKQQVQAGEAGRAPIHAIGPNARVSQFIRGRVDALGGKAWHYHGVVSPDRTGLSAKQAIALYAAASRVERRTHAFARTNRATKRQRTDLTKGMT